MAGGNEGGRVVVLGGAGFGKGNEDIQNTYAVEAWEQATLVACE
jgi:hypothetical protein